MRGLPFGMYLDALARSESLVPDEGDRLLLADAADVVRNRLADGTQEPLVLVIAGPDSDPVVGAVMEMQDAINRVADEVATFDDHFDGLRRLLQHPAQATPVALTTQES